MSTLAEQVAAYKAAGNKQSKADAGAAKPAESAPAPVATTAAPEAPKPAPAKPAEAKVVTPVAPAAPAPAPTSGHPAETPGTLPPGVEAELAAVAARVAKAKGLAPETPKAPEAAAPSAPPAAEPPKPLLSYAGKEFKSADEVVAYIAQLEREKATKEAFVEGLQAAKPAQPAAPPEPEVKLEELIFEDPARALAIIRESAIREVRQEFAARDTKEAQARQVASAWDRFYSANPRLKEFPEIVNTALNEIVTERGANFDIEQGLKLLGERSMQRLDIYRDRLTPAASETTLPTAPAVVASGGLAPTPAPVQAPKVLSFTDQVRSMHKRGVKS